MGAAVTGLTPDRVDFIVPHAVKVLYPRCPGVKPKTSVIKIGTTYRGADYFLP
jgi:hypothetical protein